MMRNFLFVTLMTLSSVAYGRVQAPELCTQKDLKVMGEAFLEMQESGFDLERYSREIGVRGGDCTKANSLEIAANRRHPDMAMAPSCGIIFILNENDQEEQANWILDSLGKMYQTSSGGYIRLCSKVSVRGPWPGATVHN